jgi:hypothetical protein
MIIPKSTQPPLLTQAAPWVKIKGTTLRRHDLAIRVRFGRDFYFDNTLRSGGMRELQDHVRQEMLVEMLVSLYAKKLDSFIVERPATWLEAWKENCYQRGYLGPWARRLWPIKYESKEIKGWQAFPDFDPRGKHPTFIMHSLEEV